VVSECFLMVVGKHPATTLGRYAHDEERATCHMALVNSWKGSSTMNGSRVVGFTFVLVTAVFSGALIAYVQSTETLAACPLWDRAMRGFHFPPILMQLSKFPFSRPSSPADMCLGAVGRFVGLLVYVRAKLGLTPSRLGVWQEIETTFNHTGKEQRGICAHQTAKYDPPSGPQVLKTGEDNSHSKTPAPE
jgi:hypothetical protein